MMSESCMQRLGGLRGKQCFAKCPFTCQFDWLSDQICQSIDWLSDHFAKHWGYVSMRGLVGWCIRVNFLDKTSEPWWPMAVLECIPQV